MQTPSSLQLFDATWIYFLGSRITDNYTKEVCKNANLSKTMRAPDFETRS